MCANERIVAFQVVHLADRMVHHVQLLCSDRHLYELSLSLLGCGPVGLLAVGIARSLGATKM